MGHFNRDRDRRGGDRRGGGFNRDRGSQRSMHKAVCDACKSNCEVPFKPTGNKPIFCSDCFSKQGGGNRHDDRDRKPRFDNRGGSSDNSKEILKGIKTLNYKLDELIKALSPNAPMEKTSKIKTTPKKSTKKTSKKKVAGLKKVIKKKPLVKKPTASAERSRRVKKKAKKK